LFMVRADKVGEVDKVECINHSAASRETTTRHVSVPTGTVLPLAFV
jgi:hypothetical protein